MHWPCAWRGCFWPDLSVCCCRSRPGLRLWPDQKPVRPRCLGRDSSQSCPSRFLLPRPSTDRQTPKNRRSYSCWQTKPTMCSIDTHRYSTRGDPRHGHGGRAGTDHRRCERARLPAALTLTSSHAGAHLCRYTPCAGSYLSRPAGRCSDGINRSRNDPNLGLNRRSSQLGSEGTPIRDDRRARRGNPREAQTAAGLQAIKRLPRRTGNGVLRSQRIAPTQRSRHGTASRRNRGDALLDRPRAIRSTTDRMPHGRATGRPACPALVPELRRRSHHWPRTFRVSRTRRSWPLTGRYGQPDARPRASPSRPKFMSTSSGTSSTKAHHKA